ncbi:MAG: hypothetical protein CVV02_15150 [Firmicutes bacterium HGW-Firmicutes-7]|nr:MAG: hypothetical protein CVV02_15150 [Firmicutes bacterium HGW-Firmicutes-7]
MTVTINFNLILAILSILSTLVITIVAIIKIYSKIAISLNNINNQQFQTNERLLKIETMLLDFDNRIDRNSEEIGLIKLKCKMTHEKAIEDETQED